MKTFKNTDEIRTERSLMRGNVVIYNLLGVILGELDRRPNPNVPVTEKDIYKVIKKLYEASIECGNKDEEEYLNQFIIKQLSYNELEAVISKIIEDGETNIGGVMKKLNVNYPSQFDGRMASEIIRKKL